MPQLNDVQNHALEIIDYLYFYDMAALGTYSEEKKEVYSRLLNGIDLLLSDRSLELRDFQIYKHFLLCGVEIVTTEDDVHADENDKGVRAPENFKKTRLVRAYLNLLDEVAKHKVNIEVFREDINKLIRMSEIDLDNSNVSRRLVSQVLWFEFSGSIAAHVYRYFKKLEILPGGRLTQNFIDNEHDEHIFLRSMLFVEFEILRKRLYFEFDIKELTQKMSDQVDGNVERKIAYYQKQVLFLSKKQLVGFCNYDLADKQKIEEYVLNISSNHCYNRIFFNSLARLASSFGAYELLYVELTNPKIPIYDDLDNEGTCSDIARNTLEELYGIKVSARTLYLCRRKIIGFYNFIRLSVESIEEVNVGFVAPDLANIFYFDPVMSEKVSSLLNELATQFKK